MQNKNLIYSIITILILISSIYFFTREKNVEKEKIKVTNNIYEKQNSNSDSAVLSSDSNTNNNQQNNIATNTQKETATSTKINIDINIINKKMKTVSIKTSMGEIEIELSVDVTPNTAENFKKLASSGFYNGTKFHRVISGFMIQGGDPLTKDNSKKNMWGTGDPGYKFADEIKSTNKNSIYTISMANSGPNTNGSQFFINTAENNFLDSKHTVFGKVTKGVEVVSKINSVDTDGMDRPLKDVIIESMTVK